MSSAPASHSFAQQWGVLLAVLSATGFAMKAVFIKYAYEYSVDALDVLMLRLALCLPFLLLARWWRSRAGEAPLTRAQWLGVLGLGFLGYYLASLLDFMGLQTVSASLERVILALYPAFTLLFGWLLFGVRISARLGFALLACLAGVLLMVFAHGGSVHGDLRGILLISASMLSFAAFMCLSARLVRELGATRFTELALLVSAAALAVHYSAVRAPSQLLSVPLEVWGYGLIMALFCTVLPIYAMTMAIERIGAGRTALIGSVGPVLSIGFSVALLGERLTVWQCAGVALVLWGVKLASQSRQVA